MHSNTTLVLGASLKPQRASNQAIHRLVERGFPVVAVGLREGEVAGVSIQKGQPELDNIDTVTLYLGPQNQEAIYEYVENLQPRRIIFNPGTENPVFYQRAKAKGIEVEVACTLVLLSLGQYAN